MFNRVEPVRVYESVVEQIEEAIYSGQIQPGDRLPSERGLMQQFGVSRATVREALRVLQSAGLVRSRPGDPNGSEVLAFGTSQLRKSLFTLARVEQLTLVELLQFRMLVESSVCELAARLCDDQQLDAIEKLLAQMEDSIDKGLEAFGEADLSFHVAIAGLAGNKLLQTCNEVVHEAALSMINTKISQAADSRAQMAESLRRHRLVYAAIRARDPKRAAQLARKHQFEYYAPYLSPDERVRIEAIRNWEPEDSDSPPNPS